MSSITALNKSSQHIPSRIKSKTNLKLRVVPDFGVDSEEGINEKRGELLAQKLVITKKIRKRVERLAIKADRNLLLIGKPGTGKGKRDIVIRKRLAYSTCGTGGRKKLAGPEQDKRSPETE